MSKETLLQLLADRADYVSGEEMSQVLGVSRAAVWKNIRTLREAGYEIDAKTNRGYRLVSRPDILSAAAIRFQVVSKNFCSEIIYLDEVDSTNSYLKRLAASGAEHGTVAVANSQTGGRGRMGRGFVSQPGKGVFLSVLLRPSTVPPETAALTAFSAVAICEAISAVSPVSPQIKWVNDIIVGDKKICGILSEMSMEAETGQVEYIVIGAGINVNYRAENFPAEIRNKATSLAMLTDEPVSREKLAAALIDAFARMYSQCFTQPEFYVARYRELCATVGRDILVLRGDERHPAHAIGISPDCGLMVRYPDGREETLHYGETSILGEHGYI
ncbi:MAG: biotin--[acetyl-CoA-carboxylase] ligase [Oscillospiraceae bacterium]|nr:biotin--[acetyl-CoA-carboxylase] ligase [Oscillospiraceae bacterium]